MKLILLCLMTCFGLFFGTTQAQTIAPQTDEVVDDAVQNSGAHCNLFYVTSSDQEALPFDNHCFVPDEYALPNSRFFRVVGPISDHVDLFRHYPWAMNFYLPVVEEAEKMVVAVPEDISNPNRNVDRGTFFVTISDYRNYSRYDSLPEQIHFAAVSGKAKITEYTPRSRNMNYPEYALQMDIQVRKVEESEGKMTFVGPEIKLRMVLRVEELD